MKLLLQEWKQTQKDYSLIQLFRIFPEALTPPYRRYFERKATVNETRIEELSESIKIDLTEAYKKKNDKFTRWFSEQLVYYFFGGIALSRYIKENEKIGWLLIPRDERKKNAITPQMIEIARDYPIENLLEVDKKHFAYCPFHDEKTPSFYCKNNYGHCFGCDWTGDVIALVMKQNNLTFPEAVRILQ